MGENAPHEHTYGDWRGDGQVWCAVCNQPKPKGENARERLAAALGQVWKGQMAIVFGGADSSHLDDDGLSAAIFAVDPQLEADIEAGAALNSDKAEPVLTAALNKADYPFDPDAILAALREGLAPK